VTNFTPCGLARPKAYKQNAEAMDAFKKTSPSVWRKSARSSTRDKGRSLVPDAMGAG